MTALDTTILTDVVCPTGCTEALVDEVCGIALCAEHSDEFVTCAASSTQLHHWGCADDCEDCQAVRAQDHAEGDD